MSWAPQRGPQAAFVRAEDFEVVYGGARGGGKTDAALGDFSLHAARFKGAAQGLLVRRTRTALEPTIARARAIYQDEGARWEEAKSRFRWPSGATLAFSHLASDADTDKYQGHSYSRVYIEELTQFPSQSVVDKLKATLRSPAGAACGLRATCNPGGAGHNWVKARYIAAGAFRPVTEGGLTRVFIPARLADNPKLIEHDPTYEQRLRQSGSEALVRAWLEGDWNAIEGAFFDKWSEANIIPQFSLPRWWTRLRSFDWGYAAPFSVGWWAVVSEPHRVGAAILPRGALVRYREWYGCTGRPNEGLRLTAEELAAGILQRERASGDEIAYGVADPSIFACNGGPSIAERLRGAGVWLRAGDNTRVGRAGALSGWDQVRARIEGQGEGPMLLVFDTCRDFIRTVPALQHDPDRSEDLDTAAEDHIADEMRYACLSRPLPAGPPPARRGFDFSDWGWSGGPPPRNAWKTM